MEKYKINIDTVTKVEDLFYSGWLFQDIKQNEIILETSNLDFNPIRLKATFITLCEGVLNSNRRGPDDPKHAIDYEQFDIHDLETLAKELTNTTGIRFSSCLVF
jgi:hypothetical protein